MAGALDSKKTGVRILLGIVIGLIAITMLTYLIPQGPGGAGATSAGDTVATVGGQNITLQDIQQQLSLVEQSGRVPKIMESFYAGQILDRLIYQKEIEYEADRLGITVTNDEVSALIKQLLPTAFNGDNPVSVDQYAAIVQQRFQLTVPAFETEVRKELLQEKFQKLVTDGISASPAELKDQFVYQNEKVKLDYVLIKPEDLEGKINPDEAELKAYFEKNKAKFQEPERRAVRYALIDVNKIKQSVQVSDEELKKFYQSNIAQYQVPERVHVEHILLFTRGMNTDAQIAEVQKRAEDVLKEVKKGGKFEDLAKKYSEDEQTKNKGGDLGWLMRGQTVAAFEKAAFSTPKGATSDLVKTEYGFHILKILDHEVAHTRPFEEVKAELAVNARANKGEAEASARAEEVTKAIRKSNKVALDDLAKQFNLEVADTAAVSAADPLLYFGNAPAVKDELFRLNKVEVSMPLKTDRGYVILSLKNDIPPHAGTFDEERLKVIDAVKKEKSVELAKSKAEELQKRATGGEKFDAAARALALDPKTSDLTARSGSISGVGSGKQLGAAFGKKVGEAGPAINLGANWFVYRVADKTEPNPDDFEKQKKELTQQVLQDKRQLAFSAFRTALEDRLKKEGKLKINREKLQGFGNLNS